MGLFDIPIVGDVLSYVGGRQANDANKDIAHNANVMSQANAREQMDFQERMANTTHAREVADLKNAGLNPILSANAGSPAPGGASGGVSTATMENVFKGAGSSAREQAALNLAVKKQGKELELMDSQKRKTDVDAKVASAGIPKAEMVNRAFKIVEPLLNKVEGFMKSNAPKKTNSGKNPSEYDMNIPNPWKKQK